MKEGDFVLVRSLNKKGFVQACSRKSVRVRIGSLSMSCKMEDLELLEKPPEDVAQQPVPFVPHPTAKQSRELERLDLHGLRVEEALKAVESRIDRALLVGLDRLQILHGLGSGRVKDALHQYLPTLRPVRSFKLDDTNAGVTWVYL